MKIINSIGSKLLAMNILAFILIGAGIITLTWLSSGSLSSDVSSVLKEKENVIYSLKLKEVLNIAQTSEKELAKTLDEAGLAGTEMANDYIVEVKNEVIEKIKGLYYSSDKNEQADFSPFIIDQDSKIVVHKELARGTSMSDQAYIEQLKPETTLTSYDKDGVTNLLFTKYMPQWQWTICCETSENELLAPVHKVKKSVASLQFNMSLFIVSIAFVSILLLSWTVKKWITRPLNEIIEGLSQGSQKVTTSSQTLSVSSQTLAQCATQSAATLEETSASLEEISSTTNMNADNAKQASILSNETNDAVQKGSSSMEGMNKAIEKVQASADETANIIKVIDEIAFQTNLLALNAAVEAARAGEAGKGFAVVAEEVRNLAMRSAEAAKNTSSLIEESVKNSKESAEITMSVDESFKNIVGKISKTANLVNEIALASDEQAKGLAQLTSAVAQMDSATQQNAHNAEECSNASTELNQQAGGMDKMVSKLIALVGGNSK